MKNIKVFLFSIFILWFILVLTIILLSPYYENKYNRGKRTNEMTAGYFEGYRINEEEININDEIDYSTICTLTINEITKEEFDNSNGINTVFDCVGEKYYHVIFSYKNVNDEDSIICEFQNLKDGYDGAKYRPIGYCDDNSNWINPPLNSKYISDAYEVVINKGEDTHIVFILYFKE